MKESITASSTETTLPFFKGSKKTVDSQDGVEGRWMGVSGVVNLLFLKIFGVFFEDIFNQKKGDKLRKKGGKKIINRVPAGFGVSHSSARWVLFSFYFFLF